MLTLQTGQATTILLDDALKADSWIEFDPLTENAAAELDAGTMYVAEADRGERTWIVTHANNGLADRIFGWSIRQADVVPEPALPEDVGSRDPLYVRGRAGGTSTLWRGRAAAPAVTTGEPQVYGSGLVFSLFPNSQFLILLEDI